MRYLFALVILLLSTLNSLGFILCTGRSVRVTSLSGSYTDETSGGNGGKILGALAVALVLRSQFSSVELRTTTVCPTGAKAANTIRIFKENDPDFHCLPFQELAIKTLTSPLVFPGDPDWDPNFLTGPRGLKISKPIR